MCIHECMVGSVSLSLGINQSRAQTPFGKLDFSERGLGTRLWLYMCIVRVSTGQLVPSPPPQLSSLPARVVCITCTGSANRNGTMWPAVPLFPSLASFSRGIIPLRYYMFTTNLRSHYVCVYVNSSNEPRPSLLGNEQIRNSTLTLASTHIKTMITFYLIPDHLY